MYNVEGEPLSTLVWTPSQPLTLYPVSHIYRCHRKPRPLRRRACLQPPKQLDRAAPAGAASSDATVTATAVAIVLRPKSLVSIPSSHQKRPEKSGVLIKKTRPDGRRSSNMRSRIWRSNMPRWRVSSGERVPTASPTPSCRSARMPTKHRLRLHPSLRAMTDQLIHCRTVALAGRLASIGVEVCQVSGMSEPT